MMAQSTKAKSTMFVGSSLHLLFLVVGGTSFAHRARRAHRAHFGHP